MSENNIENNHNKHLSPPIGMIPQHKTSVKQEMSNSGKVNLYNSLISHTGAAQESAQVHLNT